MPRPKPYVAFADRLKLICDEVGVPGGHKRVTAVATQFGVSRETARLWFAGCSLPEPPRLIEIAEEYRCSLDWLLMGRETVPRRIGEQAPGYDALSPQEQRLVTAIRALASKRRAGLLALLCEQ
jgi:hypothetical protein